MTVRVALLAISNDALRKPKIALDSFTAFYYLRPMSADRFDAEQRTRISLSPTRRCLPHTTNTRREIAAFADYIYGSFLLCF